MKRPAVRSGHPNPPRDIQRLRCASGARADGHAADTREGGGLIVVFWTRAEAGRQLAERLRPWQTQSAVVVALAPRGVEVAAEVAQRLDLPLDAVLVHEVELPGCPPGVLGAVGENGSRHLNAGLAARFGIDTQTLEREARTLAADLATLRRTLRAHVPEQPLAGRTVLLVDDGVATGAAATVAVANLRQRGAKPLVLALPVGARGTLERLRTQADSVVCVRQMPWPRPVCEWYEHYENVVGHESLRRLIDMDAARSSARSGARLVHV